MYINYIVHPLSKFDGVNRANEQQVVYIIKANSEHKI